MPMTDAQIDALLVRINNLALSIRDTNDVISRLIEDAPYQRTSYFLQKKINKELLRREYGDTQLLIWKNQVIASLSTGDSVSLYD